ncbi:MAG: hypothetical protein HEQ33_22295 [Dolichospermum sp. WA123]|nr:hypothetical protein [Dolichospermum sp. WA123]
MLVKRENTAKLLNYITEKKEVIIFLEDKYNKLKYEISPIRLDCAKLGVLYAKKSEQSPSSSGETHLNFIDKTPFLCINERIGIYRLIDFFRVIVMV